VNVEKWLVVKSNGAARLTTRKPALDDDEIAMRLSITIPNGIFHRPTLTATIAVPDSAVPPATIAADVVSDVEDTLRSAGMQVLVALRGPSDE